MSKDKSKVVKESSSVQVIQQSPREAKITVHRKIFGEAPETRTFVLHDGRKLRTVYELIDELETMPDDVFRQFDNDAKNDFANWIRNVFDDRALADELQKIRSRIDTQRAILKHLVREFRKIEHSKS